MRISCIADTHLTVSEFESYSMFPRKLIRLPPKRAVALYERIRNEVQRAYTAGITWLKRHRPWNLLVHLGDVTGGWQEQGCSHPSAQRLTRDCVDQIRSLAPTVRWCLGNHETGYRYPLALPAGSGFTLASFHTCEEIFGDLFWAHEEAGLLSLGVCSPVAEYDGVESTVLQRRREQQIFVGDRLASWRGPWILYAHSPFSAGRFAKEIHAHLPQLHAMVCGDLHHARAGTALKYLAGIPGLPFLTRGSQHVTVYCLRKLVACPSLAPLWWQGYHLLTLRWLEDTLTTKEIAVSRPPDSDNPPTSSLWRCFWWSASP